MGAGGTRCGEKCPDSEREARRDRRVVEGGLQLREETLAAHLWGKIEVILTVLN
jgi:hypothetical protein